MTLSFQTPVDFWLATSNEGKVIEIKKILEGLPIQIKTLKDLKNSYPIPDETGLTFQENALIKLKAFQKIKPHSWILSEDSGIEIQALHGRPGVYSARYQEEKSSWKERLQCLLDEMKNTPLEKRKAQMVSSAALSLPNQSVLESLGVIRGSISKDIRGVDGFAYDFIFIPEGQNKTIAEIGMDYKNKHSHRYHSISEIKKKFLKVFKDHQNL